MPLQIAPGTTPEPFAPLDHLVALVIGGAPHIPGGVAHSTESLAAAHRRQGELTSELTDKLRAMN
ncbi:hypothetical protein [Lichenibacterium dinghuense]|uniref:hypothetical protein n=1 Tax=Lichenibacterium dinghuense TaxID=2895977 RepID=UPI001F37DB2F|nr:hypothetical protein [Lichenibacterium sp. 6Y81]